ncbi:hypothetical protein ACPPVW_07940 [Leifsonia sp. McL0607]|uniref:hypothetical protein n=1 Tax=Leifsonia sp. McL0607 TaxID=3415672 RepID=UPI003CF88F93
MMIVLASVGLLAACVSAGAFFIAMKITQDELEEYKDAPIEVSADYRWDGDLEFSGVNWGVTESAWKMNPDSPDGQGATFTSTANSCTLTAYREALSEFGIDPVAGDDRTTTLNLLQSITGWETADLEARLTEDQVSWGDEGTDNHVDVLNWSENVDGAFRSFLGRAFAEHDQVISFTTLCENENDFRTAVGEANSTLHVIAE